MTITVSTDGSALGNPNGPMGWAWADHEAHAGGRPGHEHSGDCDAGGATNGTNQIGELCAVLEVLRAHPGSEPLVIETDSQYAINCSTKWVHGWKRNGWRNSQKKPVKNAAVIKAIDVELAKRPGPVKFVWVKGHAGNAGNEKVDELARTYAEDCRSGARDGYLPKEGWESLLASEYAKGTDVPADAQMLMDGKITAAEYHLGHGEDTGGVGAAGGSSGSAARADARGTGVAADRSERTDRGERSHTSHTSRDRGTKSLTQRLAGEEGVPELADFSAASTATNASAGGTGIGSSNRTVGIDVDNGSVDDGGTIISGNINGGTTGDRAAGHASAGSTPTEIDTDRRNAATAEDGRNAAHSRQLAEPQASGPATGTVNDIVQNTRQTAARQTSPAASQSPRRATGSGLHASGRIRITPPPSSSPSFAGGTITINGTISFTGTVDADGYMQLDGDVTIIPHGSRG
ncbi:ribonuclease H [Bifidobacterium tissieri]|uniref:ribonuclease H n=1 Tax=Bifidobacterium tissieri TaxID=1630162 RepID=A0A261FDF0_9BIFI|nr:ribonuclease H [Bifidobacterium tissieri]OZG57164.1 ribonuclease H [Bifidobacterium tissieri]